MKRKNEKRTFLSIKEKAKDFDRIKHFKKAFPNDYFKAYREGWVYMLFPDRKPELLACPWTEERVMPLLEHFASMTHFQKDLSGAYMAARRQGFFHKVQGWFKENREYGNNAHITQVFNG